MTKPLISVIVPVFGTAGYVGECLESLLGQTLADMEIIAIDDASPDSSRAILEDFAKRDSRIVVLVNDGNRNLFETRAIGFRHARGDFIAVCDSDDSMPKTALQRLYSAALLNQADIVHGRTRERGERGGGGIAYSCEPFRANGGVEALERMYTNTRGWNVWGKLWRRRVVAKQLDGLPMGTGWFMAEDLLYSTLFCLESKRYATIGDTVYLYRRARENRYRESVNAVKHMRDQIEILAYIENFLSRHPARDRLLSRFGDLTNHILGSMARQALPEAEGILKEIAAENGFHLPASVPSLLSWRYHYDWLCKNGAREYYIRIRSLAAAVRKAGWKETVCIALGKSQ